MGIGFTLYYILKKRLAIGYLVLSIILGLPGTLMILIELWDDYEGVVKSIPKLSVSNFYDRDIYSVEKSK